MLIVIPSDTVRFLMTLLQDSFDKVSDMMDDTISFFFKNKQTLANFFLYSLYFPKNYVSM